MNRPADWQQRERGRDCRHSYIVQAPAGSGKTELLTQRMLGLLARVANPEEVVAITFTRKAAAEMSHRLISHLRAAARQQKGFDEQQKLQEHEQVSRDLALAVLDHDREMGWGLLEQPGRLRIRTIDSLCSELARQLPILSGLGGGQKITEDATALYREAAVRTMAAIEEDNHELRDDVVRILDRYDNQYDRLVGLLTGMLASREQWLGHLFSIRNGEAFDRQGMQAALEYLVHHELSHAREKTPDHLLDSLPRFFNFALSNAPRDETSLKALLDFAGTSQGDAFNLPVTADALPHWKTMIRRLITSKGDKWRSSITKNDGFPSPAQATGEDELLYRTMKEDFIALLDTYRDDDALREIYKSICNLPNPRYEDEAWDSLESLMRILMHAAGNWLVVMAETGEMDFAEVANRAIQSLGHENAPSDLALRMDYRIQHLLVDEFQDTSVTQVNLLKHLTAGWSDGDGRTLFLVGDPMQSIYRFRKAEVSLFIKAWDGLLFDHIRLDRLGLTVNFRSDRPIVNWVNQVFPSVMPSRSDPLMGAVSYSPAQTRPDVSDEGAVSLHMLPERNDEEEARRVIEAIRANAPGQTIAILVRSRSHAGTILAELDKRKNAEPCFRYKAIKLTCLADTTLVRDLVSLTLALIQPADRLAWLATLRSPYIGLDLKDLDALVAGEAGGIILDAIESTVNHQGRVALSASGQGRIQRAGPVLIHAARQRGRQSSRSIVEAAWLALGGPACVGNDSELQDASTFFDLLDTLQADGIPIDRDTLGLRLADLYAEPDALADGQLQILTMHSAKGLQFDTVILPGLNRGASGDNSKLLHWFELAGQGQIVMSPMRNQAEKDRQKKEGDLISFISGIEGQRQRLEEGRLLYVAVTRARKKLYLFGAIKPNAKGEIKASARSLLGSLWPAVEAEQTPLISEAAATLPSLNDEPDEVTDSIRLQQRYRRLPENWQLPDTPMAVRQERAEYADTRSYIEFSWAGEDARHTGNLVHRLLQWLGEKGRQSWDARGGMSGHERWCRQQLASEGIHADKADAIIGRVTLAMNNCLNSEKGQWILHNHQQSRCEYAITMVMDKEKPVSLVLDRTFIDDGVRWIIDYKTSSHSGGDLEGFLESEQNRYRDQLERYRQAMALTESRPIKTALYFPLMDRFVEVG